MNSLEGLFHFVNHLPSRVGVVSPGSRNAPVVSALSKVGFQLHTAIDERAAGFLALGMAKALGQPIVLSCTSGSAVVNYYPAVVEAFYARIPLIILTADRPPESIHNWDGQAIMQTNIFAPHIRGFFELSIGENAENGKELGKLVANHLKNSIPGPIQINLPFREPFYSELEKIKEFEDAAKPEQLSFSPKVQISLHLFLQDKNIKSKKILIVHGDAASEQITIANDAPFQAVSLADITANQPSNIPNWYQRLDDFPNLESLCPDILITTGTTIVNRKLRLFLKKCRPKKHFHISHYSEMGNPYENDLILVFPEKKYVSIDLDVNEFNHQENAYFQLWQKAINENSVAQNIDLEAEMVREIICHLPDKSTFFVGNSMPIRHVSNHAALIAQKKINILANRGVSGIDGCLSTAIGFSKANKEKVYVLIGDVAMLYEMNSLLNVNEDTQLIIIVLNNKGGRIFEKINAPSVLGKDILYLTTPHNFNFEYIAKQFGLSYFVSGKKEEFQSIFTSFKGNLLFEVCV